MEPVRYGIIGLGQVATKGHIPSLLTIPDAKIVAIADVNPDALSAARESIGDVRAYPNAAGLIGDEGVEAVIIATPNWLHKEQAVAAFGAGKHLFCEKPLGIDLGEADAIIAAQQKSGKLLQVGHELRYSKLMAAAKQKVDEGLIGRVKMVVISEYRFPLLPGWRQTGKTGGVMLEKNSHFLDLFNWFVGTPPQRVVAVGGNNVNSDSPLIDHCIVTVEYEGCVPATLLMCLYSEHGSQLTLDVVGDQGRLIVYGADERMVHYRRDNPEPQTWELKTVKDGAWHIGFKEEHEAFIRSIREGAPVLVDGPESRRTMVVCLAAERAVEGETTVLLD